VRLKGLGTVKAVEEGQTMTISPMVMGFPKPKAKSISVGERQELEAQLHAAVRSCSENLLLK
jgi:hypothetical protein